jgi:O-antigen/teichoic acid export membrane protein
VQGASAVAIYKVAKTLSSLPVRMIGPLWVALRPKMMQVWYARSKQRMLKLVATPSVLILTVLVLVFIPIKSTADDLILFLYNKSYVAGTVTFLTLLIGTWIFGAATAWFNFWIIISEEKIAGILAYGFLLVSIISTGFLYGRQSIEHMAIAVCASMIVTSIFCWLIFLKKLLKETSKSISN